MKKLLTLFLAFGFLLSGFCFFVNQSQAAVDLWGGQKSHVQDATGYSDPEDPRVIAGTIINIFLEFLGIIAVVLILWAGFNWMTAAGNEEKIEKAKSTLTAAIIGLIIILAAWGIANFVLSNLAGATS